MTHKFDPGIDPWNRAKSARCTPGFIMFTRCITILCVQLHRASDIVGSSREMSRHTSLCRIRSRDLCSSFSTVHFQTTWVLLSAVIG